MSLATFEKKLRNYIEENYPNAEFEFESDDTEIKAEDSFSIPIDGETYDFTLHLHITPTYANIDFVFVDGVDTSGGFYEAVNDYNSKFNLLRAYAYEGDTLFLSNNFLFDEDTFINAFDETLAEFLDEDFLDDDLLPLLEFLE